MSTDQLGQSVFVREKRRDGAMSLELGDLFAIDSYLIPDERLKVKEVLWCYDRVSPPLLTLTKCIFGNASHRVNVPQTEIGSASELGCEVVEEAVRKGRRRYQESTFAAADLELPSVEHLGLPQQFVVIHPFSINSQGTKSARDLDDEDCAAVLTFLEEHELHAVVINRAHRDEPWIAGHPLLTDLTNQTNILEGVALLRRSIGFIGCGSSWSVLATKLRTCRDDLIFIRGAPDRLGDAIGSIMRRDERAILFIPIFGGSRRIAYEGDTLVVMG